LTDITFDGDLDPVFDEAMEIYYNKFGKDREKE